MEGIVTNKMGAGYKLNLCSVLSYRSTSSRTEIIFETHHLKIISCPILEKDGKNGGETRVIEADVLYGNCRASLSTVLARVNLFYIPY